MGISDKERFQTHLTKLLRSSVLDSAVRELELKAGGLFLYATLLAAELDKQDSKLDFAALQGLPGGLSEIYQVNFDRMVGADKQSWRKFVSVIALVVAAREPSPQALVQEVHEHVCVDLSFS